MSNLADLRIARGLTQKRLAELTGASERAIQGWENGDVPRAIYQEKLAKVLKVSISALGFEDQPMA